ncbi:MAG TPA: hypothetical protein VFK05_13545 [Polyangiaceae bacterium]|nr:hypothetical protein [Polyangiaceae bacterium]
MLRITIWAAALLGMLYSRSALAEDATSPADESFLRGRALLNDKRYSEACPKFEESQREDPASGTLLALAYCQELAGRLATSWRSYIAAADLATREGHAERVAAARDQAQKVAERASKLTLVVAPELLALPGFRVLADGIELERASLGVALAMDGGSHVFEAQAPGRMPWKSTVTLLNERDQKILVLPILDPVPTPPAPALAPAPRAAQQESPHLDTTPQPAKSGPWRPTSLALLAGGAVGLGLGTAFGFAALSKNNASNADGHCDSTGCDDRGSELRNDALSAARVSTWCFIAGGALAATGITLYLTSQPSSGGGHGTRVGASLAPGAPSLWISERF